MTYAVLLSRPNRDPYVYGPFGDRTLAAQFAAFLRAEVDPAVVVEVLSPVRELLCWREGIKIEQAHQRAAEQAKTPEYWPPKPGDTWQDRVGDRWCCQQDGTLACLAVKGIGRPDDTATEIARVYGPMRLVYRPEPTNRYRCEVPG